MYVINTDTNAAIGGYVVPRGSFEFPLEGSVGIITSQGGATNLVCQGGDTLMVWSSGAAVIPGVAPYQMFLLGVFLVVGVFGLVAIARRYARLLSAGKVKEV